MNPRPKPILYAAFANDQEDASRHLSGLDGEKAEILAALAQDVCEDGPWEVVCESDCTSAELVKAFAGNRVTIFHYAGHANPETMLLETSDGGNQHASAQKLEDFLRLQPNLKLVFLNACCTQAWAQRLVALGIPCVIATSRPVLDSAAPHFASAFYKSLADGRSTIAQAFQVASAGVDFQRSQSDPTPQLSRDMSFGDADPGWTGLPWAIYPPPPASGAYPADHPAQWTLSIGADDPLLGVPPLDPSYYALLDRKQPNSPYVSIQGHKKEDAALFFGRGGEIRALYDWAIGAVPGAPILLFYGQSGVGKSSLLNAGLLPRLPSSLAVKCVRRRTALIDELHAAIGGETDDIARAWLTNPNPQLLILDQVEEEITHNAGASEGMSLFLNRVAYVYSLAPASQRTARLILSFRKEYLAEIRNELAASSPANSPELLQDFWLERFSRDAILQVVNGPLRSAALRNRYRLTIEDPDLPGRVADDLDKDDLAPIATILQVMLAKLWERAVAAAPQTGGNPVYTQKLYLDVASSNPLKDFYDEQLAQLGSKIGETNIDAGLELDLLFEHTTDLVTSNPRTIDDLKKTYPTVPNLEEIVNRNVGGLLTRYTGGNTAPVTALAHDTLAPVIRREFELSVLPGSRARRILENRARNWNAEKKQKGDPLDSADLRLVRKGQGQMRALNPDEEWLLKLSTISFKRKRRLLVGAVCLFLFVVLSFQVHIEAARISALDQAAQLIGANDKFSGRVHELAAQAEFVTSRLMAISFHWGLSTDLNINGMFDVKSPQRDRISVNTTDFINPCSYVFDPAQGYVYTVIGTNRTLGGKQVGGNISVLACDPVSKSGVGKTPDGKMYVLHGDQSTEIPQASQMILTAPVEPTSCAEQLKKATGIVNGISSFLVWEGEDTPSSKEQKESAREWKEAFKSCKDQPGVAGMNSLRLSSGAKKLVAELSSGTLQILDVASGELTTVAGSPDGDLAFSVDSHYMAQPDARANLVRVWDLESTQGPRLIDIIRGATIAALGGPADHPILATSGPAGVRLSSLANRDGTDSLASHTYAMSDITALAVSPDARFFAVANTTSGPLVSLILIPPDLDYTRKIVGDPPADFDNRGILFKSPHNWTMQSFVPNGHVTRMSFSDDSTFLVTASSGEYENTAVATWRLATEPGDSGGVEGKVQAGCTRLKPYIDRNAAATVTDIESTDFFVQLKKNCDAVTK